MKARDFSLAIHSIDTLMFNLKQLQKEIDQTYCDHGVIEEYKDQLGSMARGILEMAKERWEFAL